MTRKSEAQKVDEAKTRILDQEIGARLKNYRRGARRSQAQMAEALDVSLRVWRGYEDGERLPASRLYEVCKTLGLQPNDFFQGLPSPAAAADPRAAQPGVSEESVAFSGPDPLLALLHDLSQRSEPLAPLVINLIAASVRGQIDLLDKGSVRTVQKKTLADVDN